MRSRSNRLSRSSLLRRSSRSNLSSRSSRSSRSGNSKIISRSAKTGNSINTQYINHSGGDNILAGGKAVTLKTAVELLRKYYQNKYGGK